MSATVSFVNRVTELNLIEEAFNDLLTKERLNNSIIDFYGVEGIGKTSILTKVIEKCREYSIPYVKIDADQDLPQLSAKIREQVQQYSQALAIADFQERGPVEIISSLLEQGPFVMLLDSVDTTNEEQLQQIGNLLRQLSLYNKFFVVLTSRRSISFEQNKSVARRLKPFAVQPLDRDGTELYLDSIQFPADAHLRETVFRWTRGYPLAMNAMVEALGEGISPSEEQGRQDLMARIVERVIAQGLLAQVKSEDPTWIKTALNLLAVPRRFNLIIMQKLIERFEPTLKLKSNLAYMRLPKQITDATGVMSWDPIKGGFAIDEPVRNILLLQLKIGRPQRYYELNNFLAEMNWQNATEVAGSDRIRYQREFLYHTANSAEESQAPQKLQEATTSIIQDAGQNTAQLVQFCRDFAADDQLIEELGPHANLVLGLIYSYLAAQMELLYEQERDDEKRFRYLHDFFYYTVRNPQTVHTDRSTFANQLRDRFLQLREQEGARHMLRVYEELGNDSAFKNIMGSEYAALQAQLYRDSDSREE